MGQALAYMSRWMWDFMSPTPPLSQAPVQPVVNAEGNVQDAIQVPPPENTENATPLLRSFRGLDRVILA
ncbi:hypothetical protein FRC10_011804, partial [Ceratobasidium sp. 414]